MPYDQPVTSGIDVSDESRPFRPALVIAVALVASPVLSLAVCTVFAIVLADVPLSYLAGVPVAGYATAAFARAHEASRSMTLRLALASCVITVAVVAMVVLLIIIVMAQSLAEFG